MSHQKYNVATTPLSPNSWSVTANPTNSYQFSNVAQTTAQVQICAPGTDDIMTISNDGEEIVTLKGDGSVIWANGNIDINPAATAFGQVMKYGSVEAHGITETVREEMRIEGWNDAFKHLTELAEMNGNLSTEDLTAERECCTIVRKLKQNEE